MSDISTITLDGISYNIKDALARQQIDTLDNRVDTAENDIQSLIAAVGTPLVAATVAAMTDHNKIYVYTGSETGYTAGNWYYWDSSLATPAWVSGGVYNSTAFNTDTTLTVAGAAADAKAAGDRLNSEDVVINNLHSLINYGYDNAYEYEEDSSVMRKKVGIKRTGMIVVINKSSTSQYRFRIKLSGDYSLAANNSEVDEWDTGFTLDGGHNYRATIKLISGTCYSETPGDGIVPNVLPIAVGGHSASGSGTQEGGQYVRKFTAEENVQYNLAIDFQAYSIYCTNAKFVVMLEDITESITANIEEQVLEVEKNVSTISDNLDALFYTREIDFETSDWRTGYYGKTSGDFTQSHLYICTANNYTINNSDATRITAKAPDGYFIAAYEYDSGGVYVKRYGDAKATNALDFPYTEGHNYKLTVGRFADKSASDHLTAEFIEQVKVSLDELKLPENNTKRDRTGDYEWFTVTVDRPLSFGGGEIIDAQAAQEIECVLRLPSTYSKTGNPTRLVLACHGAHGYIQSSTNTWYNANWKTFMDDVLSAGYAVFDANIFPTSTGTDQMGYALGSPLYVNVLKKAYDYIQKNYNVYEQIFAHGTSMGGVGATAFSQAYPELVLAESSFAGRDFLRYLLNLENGTASDERFAISYGYSSLNELTNDKFSHCEGCFPSLSIVKYVNGTAQIPPDRETDYPNWLTYFCQIADLERNDDAGIWMGNRKLPYKAWNSWADNEAYTKLQTVLQKAYNRGNACLYYTVNYESGTHTEMSYGQINNMIPQLISWYKRFE